jgi:hypothetical protein
MVVQPPMSRYFVIALIELLSQGRTIVLADPTGRAAGSNCGVGGLAGVPRLGFCVRSHPKDLLFTLGASAHERLLELSTPSMMEACFFLPALSHGF